MLIVAHQPITQLFFSLSGFASITNAGNTNKIEIGMIGPEGLIGTAVRLIEAA